MRWTNKYNLPEPVVSAVMNDDYNAGKSDITVTQLVAPPRITVLKQKYKDQIVEDVAEGFYRMMGKCIHKILEYSNYNNSILEKRLYSNYKPEGLIISGQLDIYYTIVNTLQDYKFTTCYSAMNGAKKEWVEQLNLLSFLAKANGLPVKKLELILFLRDFSKTKVAKNPQYPKAPVIKMPVEIFSDEKVEWLLNLKIQAYLSAKKRIPLCSENERWKKPDQFAVLKDGGKKAIKVFQTEQEAQSFVEKSDIKYCIQKRTGKSIRCEYYCPVSQFCDQWKKEQKSLTD
jgi:hypothetical protein